MDLATRKSLNIVFNRATNDMARADRSTTVTRDLNAVDVISLAASIPPKAVDTPEFWRCVQTTTRRVADLVAANSGWLEHARNTARTLGARFGVQMPIVVCGDTVINGIGRLQYYSERRQELCDVVELPPSEAEFARYMLNLLSMDFDVHTRYADVLRYNSFRRSFCTRFYLGQGFVHHMDPRLRCKDFDVTQPHNRDRWVKFYGRSVVDFGSGHGEEARLLREAGVRVASFEPFLQADDSVQDAINIPAARAFCQQFLADIADGRPFSSVFVSSVLNSVPFQQDREHIVTILAALCGPRTRCYAYTKSVQHAAWQAVMGADHRSEHDARMLRFALDYEPGIILGDYSTLPKVQKHFTASELYALFKARFGVVRVTPAGPDVAVVAGSPLPVDPAALAAALEFEFNLPYPDGSRLGLVADAKAAFSKRVGVPL
jgi:hypothetical protein